MEYERVRALQEYEDRELRVQAARLEGAGGIRDQIREREEQRCAIAFLPSSPACSSSPPPPPCLISWSFPPKARSSPADVRLIDEELRDQETQAMLQQMRRMQDDAAAAEARKRDAARRDMKRDADHAKISLSRAS